MHAAAKTRGFASYSRRLAQLRSRCVVFRRTRTVGRSGQGYGLRRAADPPSILQGRLREGSHDLDPSALPPWVSRRRARPADDLSSSLATTPRAPRAAQVCPFDSWREEEAERVETNLSKGRTARVEGGRRAPRASYRTRGCASGNQIAKRARPLCSGARGLWLKWHLAAASPRGGHPTPPPTPLTPTPLGRGATN